MTLPNQPASPVDVLANQEYYRIRQPVTSPGDFFEIDTSTRAIYLGPESDVSEVRLQYFDKQAARQMNIADISAGGPYVNRVDSLLATQYPGIGQQARIGAYSVDIVDPNYVRQANFSTQTPVRRYNIIPYIDLICALKQLPSIPQVRPDKTYRLKVPFKNAPNDSDDDNGSTDVVIPIYGRRMVSILTITPLLTPHFTNVYMAALPPGVNPGAKGLGNFVTPSDAFVMLMETAVFRASDQTDGLTTPTNEQTNYPLTKCKGMGDLLIVNFQPNFPDPAPPGYSMLDVIIRVSDREQ